LQIPKVPLDLVEEPPGLVALRGQQAAPVLQASRGAAGHGAEDVEVGDQRFRCRGLGAHRRQCRVISEVQHKQWVGQHELARGLRPRDIALIQATDLAGGESMWRDPVSQAHAVARVGARQRHEVLHRRVRDNVSIADVLLDGVGQRAHETEAPRHPAHAPIEPPRQDVQRQRMIIVQSVQQPRLLKRALGGVGLQQMPKDQRVAFPHVPAHRGDGVAVQPAQAADAFVAIHHHVERISGHDHDRHLLAGVGERSQQTPLPRRLADTKPFVAQIQLVKFEVHGQVRHPHDGRQISSRAPDVPDRPKRPAQLRTRPPTDDAALPADPPAHDRRHGGQSAESSWAEGTLIHHATPRAIGALVIAMIQASFRTLLMPAPGRAHAGEAPGRPAGRRTVGVSTIAGGANPKRPCTRSAYPRAKR
jgi:hypothetical protein